MSVAPREGARGGPWAPPSTIVRVALFLAGALPWLRAFGGRLLPTAVVGAIDLAFAPLCHHAPERTLVLLGQPMCVCSRCAGIYAGIAIAALVGARAALSVRAPRRALEVGGAMMALDVLAQAAGLYAPFHPARLATGLVVGWAMTSWMLAELGPVGGVEGRVKRPALQPFARRSHARAVASSSGK